MTVINWQPVNGADSFDGPVARVFIAGFTGREAGAVQEHVDELAELGVPVPDRIPAFYTVDPSLLTVDEGIEVAGAFTSGEVEPVIVVQHGRRWLTVGSDHTDRELEASGIELSKRACPKPISNQVVPIDEALDWDRLEIRSWADAEGAPYQDGRLAQILPLAAIESELEAVGHSLRDGDVMFLGTVPVNGGELRPSTSFRAELRDPGRNRSVELNYSVRVRAETR